MKNLTVTLFFLLIIANLSAEIAVKSFRKLESDMTARIDAPKKDQNGDVCAIIKVVTTQTGFIWEPDGLGIVAALPKVGEYWLYVPYGAKRLTVKHSQLGVLRDYMYNIPIEKATVYEMILTTGKVITTVEESIESQWLVINPEPTDASIYIDDIFVKTGTYSAKYKPGNYTYRIEAPLYHTEAGKLEITDTKKEITAKLKPAFGYISVSTSPEQDAKVIIDGKPLTNNTPTKSEALASGQHTVQVIKEMYQPTTQKVNVTDGLTTSIIIKMQPNFAEVTISSAPEATLYVNGIQKGIGSWTGRLSAGIYTLESRRNKYKSVKQDIELKAGDVKTVNLQTTPIYGSLDIISTPLGASISINGTDYGTTPNTIKNLLIGDYAVNLKKTGFANVNKTVTVIEGKSIEMNEKMFNSGSLKIMSNPSNADIYVDGNLIGKTPFNAELSYGKHTIKVTQDDKSIIQEIDFNTVSASEINVELYECNVEKLISSTPSYASILIDGKKVGSTPLFYQMLNTEEQITIMKDGYKTYRDKIYCQNTGVNAFLQPIKKIYFGNFLSLGIPLTIGYGDEFLIGTGIGLNVKLLSWVFIKNELNANSITSYGLNYSRIHSICVGLPIDYENNLFFGEYGVTYNSGNYFNKNSNIWGIGYGNYQNNLNFRVLDASAIELSLRFGLFSKSNKKNYWEGVKTVLSILTLGIIQ